MGVEMGGSYYRKTPLIYYCLTYCLFLLFFQNVRNVYNRCVQFLQIWTALGGILTFVWPLGAVLHRYIQAMVEDCIPSALLRLWELWGIIQMLWDHFN